MKKRKGFSLIEVLASTIMLSVIVIACIAVINGISTQKGVTENTVYLSVHNVSCMERLKNMTSNNVSSGVSPLLDFYGDEVFGTSDIKTQVIIETAKLDQFYVYFVTIKSRMRDFPQSLTSEYILTTIGAVDHGDIVS